MKKNYLFFVFILSSFFGIGQNCPNDLKTYYSSATGVGYILKTQLYNIIKGHTVISYTPGLWNLYYTSDVNSDGKVWDIYSNCNFVFGAPLLTGGNQDDGKGGKVECERYNREHTFPKSWFGGSSGMPMYTDAFHVMPTDKKDNGMRGSIPYGIVGNNPTYVTNNNSKIGICTAPNTPTNLTVFEPADQYKGDIARNYFYMATRYEDKISNWQNITVDANAVLDGSNDQVYEKWYLDLMITWHLQDPVSQKEIDRNNAVCAAQHNRNPFIDHPEYVCQIWSAQCQALSNAEFQLQTNISLYPNPSNGELIKINSEIELDEIQVYNINGQLIQKDKNPIKKGESYDLVGLSRGFYLVKLTSGTQSVTKKIIVQ
ncbi:ribonuclease [Flavobacterium columnare]|uniref:endonuclease n=1 Tax=Flavobacterium columnare TaxID=996 RepID=UPI0009814ADD|nr:endonuclease [Flavobacterium columnare]OOB84306.1 ribonuclease [Flavobacterium columnare]